MMLKDHVIIEHEQQVLPQPLKLDNASACQVVGNGLWSSGLCQARIDDTDVSKRVPAKYRHESSPNRLNFWKLGHRSAAALSATFEDDAAVPGHAAGRG